MRSTAGRPGGKRVTKWGTKLRSRTPTPTLHERTPMIRVVTLTALAAALTTYAPAPARAADPAPLVLVQTIPLKGAIGKLDHLAVDARGGRLFVANKVNNTLDVVDL